MNAPAAYLPRATTRDKRIAPPHAYGRYAIAIRLRDAVVRIIRANSGASTTRHLVDFGCGDMPYRPLVESSLASYNGIDLPGNAAAHWHLLPDGSTTAHAGCADLLLSTQVLEHVSDVDTYLAECHRLLAPDGRLLLTTHGSWVYHADPADYWRWTAQGLRETLSRHGFHVESVEGLLGLMPMGLQFFQDGLVRKLPKWSRATACLILQKAALLADRFHTDAERGKDACVYVIVARKRT